jgi:hypothetical protein
MIDKKNNMPVGVFTLSMAVLAVTFHYWPKPSCEVLEQTLNGGYFMRWQAPELLIVLSSKKQLSFNGDSKENACKAALNVIVGQS